MCHAESAEVLTAAAVFPDRFLALRIMLDHAFDHGAGFEQGFIFYYAFCGLDPEFSALVLQGKILDESVKSFLIREEDYDLLLRRK